MHFHYLLLLEYIWNWKNEEDGGTFSSIFFFAPLTVKYPTYDVCTRYMHESHYKLNSVYQI